MVKELTYLRAGDLESGRGVNCDGGDGGDLRRTATTDASASADALGCGRMVDGRGRSASGWLLCNNRRRGDSGGSSWL